VFCMPRIFMPRPFENLSNSLRTSFRGAPQASGMRIAESRWRSRRRGYYYLVTAVGLFGLFLILAGISARHWTWFFAVLGFASLILWMRKGFALWEPNRHLVDRARSGSAFRHQPADMARPQSRERVRRGCALGSKQLRLAEPTPSVRQSKHEETLRS
jgi:hypothetical protein